MRYKFKSAELIDYVPLEDDFNLLVFDDVWDTYFDSRVSSLYKKAEKAIFLFISRGNVTGYKSRYCAFADSVYSLTYKKSGIREYFGFFRLFDEFENDNSIPKGNYGKYRACL